jgi:tRNA modification GTPase
MESPFDTIFALATPRAPGERAVLRVSGAEAFDLLSRLLGGGGAAARGRTLLRAELHIDAARPELRVPALVLGFVGPASYTGEDVVELHVLSAPMLIQLLEQRLQQLGARPAWAGEFTRRAFENGRMDLLQAEAVRARIAARSDQELRVSQALAQGQGIDHELERRVLDLHALLEAGLDFESFESLAVDREQWLPELREIVRGFSQRSREYAALDARFARARYLLLGPPSAGKTTLWNELCGGAGVRHGLVAAAPGTTRDVRWGDAGGVELGDAPGRYEFELREEGVTLHDEDELELLLRELQLADGYVLVLAEDDALPPLGALPAPSLLIRSKAGEGASRARGASAAQLSSPAASAAEAREALVPASEAAPEPAPESAPVCVSVHERHGLAELRARLATLGRRGAGLPHVAAFAGAAEGLERALELAESGAGEEIVSVELRRAASLLPGADSGEIPESLLDRVFARHCLGK